MRHSTSAVRPLAAAAAGAGSAVGADGSAGARCEAITGGRLPGAAFSLPGALAGASAPSASSTTTTLPSATLSPTLTRTSRTTPAADDGTSIVALSDSSVARPWSTATVSPTATSTSITGTSSKPPMSGTFTSIVFAMAVPSEHGPAHVAEQLREIGGEARRGGPVDHAVVVGQRQRQHESRLELLAVPDRLHGRLRHPEDGNFRRVHDRREAGAADAAQGADRETAAGHLGRAELAFARLLRQRRGFLRDLDHALAVAVAHHRHHQPVGRVGGEADMEVLLEDERLARRVERGVELRVLLQRRHRRLHDEGEHGELDPGLLVLAVELDAQVLERGDVGIVVLGDVRDHRPVARE